MLIKILIILHLTENQEENNCKVFLYALEIMKTYLLTVPNILQK